MIAKLKQSEISVVSGANYLPEAVFTGELLGVAAIMVFGVAVGKSAGNYIENLLFTSGN